jgi:L,D-peptidoglycan transpeptidase YkuD (ErfK/YbiS/YcfS/YnhG family)
VAGSRQVVVVTAAGWSTSYARLQAWQQRADGQWRRVMDPVPARLGWNGFAPEAGRLQGSGETPAGTFRLLRGFGLVEPRGVRLDYRVLDATDWWPYDPKDKKTYNVFQFRRTPDSRWRPSWAEDLDSYTRQYRHAVVLDYNLPSGIRWVDGQRVARVPADTTKGGGIFLHVWDDGPTAGCVAVSRADMRWLLRWLDPGDRPVIVMGPLDAIERM